MSPGKSSLLKPESPESPESSSCLLGLATASAQTTFTRLERLGPPPRVDMACAALVWLATPIVDPAEPQSQSVSTITPSYSCRATVSGLHYLAIALPSQHGAAVYTLFNSPAQRPTMDSSPFGTPSAQSIQEPPTTPLARDFAQHAPFAGVGSFTPTPSTRTDVPLLPTTSPGSPERTYSEKKRRL